VQTGQWIKLNAARPKRAGMGTRGKMSRVLVLNFSDKQRRCLPTVRDEYVPDNASALIERPARPVLYFFESRRNQIFSHVCPKAKQNESARHPTNEQPKPESDAKGVRK